MKHYIREIEINKVRQLSGITISLDSEKRQHLLLTGKNGSGKTSLLRAIKNKLQKTNENEEKSDRDQLMVNVQLCNREEVPNLFSTGQYITAFFGADRLLETVKADGVEDVKLNTVYGIEDDPSRAFLKYMVHIATQKMYRKQEGDQKSANNIQQWFDRFENALKILFDDESIRLEYDYRNYNFLIHQKGHEPFGFDQLSDGFSSVIQIVTGLMLRMDQNWLLSDEISTYDKEGVVLIDELETHLHIDLQRTILPFLEEFFPAIQFIISTHSPYILTSVSDVLVYDLERQVALTDLSDYSVADRGRK